MLCFCTVNINYKPELREKLLPMYKKKKKRNITKLCHQIKYKYTHFDMLKIYKYNK